MISVLFCSCKIIKQIDFSLKANKMMKQTEETYNYGKDFPFVFDKETILLPCKINGATQLLHYDSRRGGGLHVNILGNAEFPQCNKTIKLRTKNSAKQRVVYKVGLKYYDVETDFFYFKNFVGIITSISNDTITLEDNQNRFIVGRDAFPNSEVAMLLSFSDTTITLFNPYVIYDTTVFSCVKSMFSCTGFTVYLTVDSIEYAFLFDTGSKTSLSLPKYEKHKKENDIFVANYSKQDISNTVIDTLIMQQTNTITMGDLNDISGNILYKKKLSQPVMGMAFISRFDWIIDTNKKKIYVKK